MENVENNSSSGGRLIISIIVILVIIVGGWLLLRDDNASGSLPENNTATTTENGGPVATTTPTGGALDEVVTVTLTTTGFSPKTVTIKKGQGVKWVNETDNEMWVGSAMHPDHTNYSGTELEEHCPDTTGTAFDQCKEGDEYTFTFNKVGSWNYHNHEENPTSFGTVIVTE